MPIDVSLVPPQETRALRELYRKEMNCQIVLDSWHGRGWTDSYLLQVNGQVVGYGLVGGVRAEPKDEGRGYPIQVTRLVHVAVPRCAACAGKSDRQSQRVSLIFVLLGLLAGAAMVVSALPRRGAGGESLTLPYSLAFPFRRWPWRRPCCRSARKR
jgi:hypothetical protein